MIGIIHFDEPGRRMLFEDPQISPVLAGLRVDGFLVDSEGQHHPIAALHDIRFLLSPTSTEVARRAMIVRQALVQGANQLASLHADAVEALVNLWWQGPAGGTRRNQTPVEEGGPG